MHRSSPSVAVFDANLPTGLAFVRSLGRAGIPVTAYSCYPTAISRYSKYVDDFVVHPTFTRTDHFVEWLSERLSSGAIDLIAPTSDVIAFNGGEAGILASTGKRHGLPGHENVLDCLLKNRFADACRRVGFPTPDTCAPSGPEEAHDFIHSIGLPVVAKPRTHVGVGVERGAIVRDAGEIESAIEAYELGDGHSTAQRHDPFLAMPLLQRFVDRPELDVVSVTGCLGLDGEVLALDHSRKTRQWPPGLGIGTHFESLGSQPFTDHAVSAVRSILGSGIFELEVLVDRASGEYWGIDLNPRGFGQMALDIARGHDLPALWYESVTGLRVDRDAPNDTVPTSWQMGLPLTTDLFITAVRGPSRRAHLRDALALLRAPSVGSAFARSDPKPGLAFGLSVLRHPGGLVRPYLSPPA